MYFVKPTSHHLRAYLLPTPSTPRHADDTPDFFSLISPNLAGLPPSRPLPSNFSSSSTLVEDPFFTPSSSDVDLAESTTSGSSDGAKKPAAEGTINPAASRTNPVREITSKQYGSSSSNESSPPNESPQQGLDEPSQHTTVQTPTFTEHAVGTGVGSDTSMDMQTTQTPKDAASGQGETFSTDRERSERTAKYKDTFTDSSSPETAAAQSTTGLSGSQPSHDAEPEPEPVGDHSSVETSQPVPRPPSASDAVQRITTRLFFNSSQLDQAAIIPGVSDASVRPNLASGTTRPTHGGDTSIRLPTPLSPVLAGQVVLDTLLARYAAELPLGNTLSALNQSTGGRTSRKSSINQNKSVKAQIVTTFVPLATGGKQKMEVVVVEGQLDPSMVRSCPLTEQGDDIDHRSLQQPKSQPLNPEDTTTILADDTSTSPHPSNQAPHTFLYHRSSQANDGVTESDTDDDPTSPLVDDTPHHSPELSSNAASGALLRTRHLPQFLPYIPALGMRLRVPPLPVTRREWVQLTEAMEDMDVCEVRRRRRPPFIEPIDR